MRALKREYLVPTKCVDSEHSDIVEFAKATAGDSIGDPIKTAVKLYYAVRDRIWYDPYYPFHLPEYHVASFVLKTGRAYCVPKATLLCALGRACGIPSRIGFATVKNHFVTKQLLEIMGCNLFVYHGYTEFFLEGKWVIATPAFNIELCKKFKVDPLEFNGREDSVFQQYNHEKKVFMEYVKCHGTYTDVPIDAIMSEGNSVYGEARIKEWIKIFNKSSDQSYRNFYDEDILD